MTVWLVIGGLVFASLIPFALQSWRHAHLRARFAPTVARELGPGLAVLATNHDSVLHGADGLRSAGLAIERVA